MVTVAPRICINRDCGRALFDGVASNEDPRYCKDCGDLVYAFCPNPEVNEWFMVAEDEDDLLAKVGDRISGDQCGNCGGSFWWLIEDDGIIAECGPGTYPDGTRYEGCGAQVPLEMKPGRLVIW